MARTPIEELRQRIVHHRSAIARITLDHGPSDGGGRTTVALIGHRGETLDTWNDWTLENDRATDVLREHWQRVERDGLGYTCTFTVSGLRSLAHEPTR